MLKGSMRDPANSPRAKLVTFDGGGVPFSVEQNYGQDRRMYVEEDLVDFR